MPPQTPRSKQLDRIENAILGNGHEGLLERTARIEEKIISVADSANSAVEASRIAVDKAEASVVKVEKSIGDLAINFKGLEIAVNTHHKAIHLSDLIKKKQFWIYLIIGFVVLHLVSTYVPNVWDWIMVLLGIPKLVIPLG